jgi:hypothetical protein
MESCHLSPFFSSFIAVKELSVLIKADMQAITQSDTV